MNEYTKLVTKMGEIEKEFGGFGNIPHGHEYFDIRQVVQRLKSEGQVIEQIKSPRTGESMVTKDKK